MADQGGVNIATLTVGVKQSGVAEATAGLDKLAAASGKAEAATQELTVTQRAMIAQFGSVDRGLAATNGQLDQYDRGLRKQTATQMAAIAEDERRSASLRKQAATQMSAVAEDERRSASLRKMALLEIQAIEMDEARTAALARQTAASGAATAATGLHGLQLGRVNMELGTAIGRFAGVNSAATRFVAMLGGALGGYEIMIAISLAVVGAAKAYDYLTESTRKAKEEQDKLTESLKKWYEAKRQGEAGTRTNEVSATRSQLAQNQRDLAEAQRIVATPGISQKSGYDVDAYRAKIPGLKIAIDEEKAIIAAGTSDVVRLVHEGEDKKAQDYASSLSARLSANQQDAAARKAALSELAKDRATLARLMALPETPENSARVADYARSVKELDAALNPKERVTRTAIDAQSDVSKQLDGQLDAMRKVDEQNKVEAKQTADAIALRHMDADSRAILANHQRAELDSLKAYHDLSGVALTDRLAAIKSIEAQNDADLKAEQIETRKVAALKESARIQKEIADIGKRNETTTKQQLDAQAEVVRKAEKYANDMHKIWRDGFAKITTDGLKSFHDFFDDVLRMATRAMDRMEQEGKGSGALYRTLGLGSAAISGGLTGFQIGRQTGSATQGAIGGAASGALSGFEIAGPMGAVVGGLAGLAGGLFGASRAATDAAKALHEIQQTQIASTLASWRAEITKTAGDQKAAAALELRVKYLSIRQQIEESEAGKKNEVQRNKDLAEADALYAQAQKGLTSATNALTDSMLNAVQGYRYQAAIFGAAPYRNAPSSLPSGPTPGSGSTPGGHPSDPGGAGNGAITFNLVLADGSALGSAVITDFKRRRARGDSSLTAVLTS